MTNGMTPHIEASADCRRATSLATSCSANSLESGRCVSTPAANIGQKHDSATGGRFLMHLFPKPQGTHLPRRIRRTKHREHPSARPAGLSVLLRRSQCFQGGNRSVSRTRRLAALWNYFSREPEAASRNNRVSRNQGQKRCPICRTLRSGSLGWGCILEHIQACLGSRGRLDRVCSGVSATWFEGVVHRFVQPIVSKVGCVWRQWKQAKAAVELCHALSCQNAQISVIDTGGLANVACN